MKRKGFTLVELLVALPIAGAVMLVFSYSFFQIMESRESVSNTSIALADIDNAVHWITQDLVMAQDTSLEDGADPVSSFSATWSDLTHWAADEGSIDYSVSYYLSGTQLIRNYSGNITGDRTIIAARYITHIDFSLDSRVFTVTLVSQPGLADSSVNRTFSCEMRTDELP
jgi:prepilin-type N-terminal cleavage/methylation domain-containing protein